jgi:hypothetical protein
MTAVPRHIQHFICYTSKPIIMNYIRHLNSFFSKAESDRWLTPHHQNLYLLFFRIWNTQGFKPTFHIDRDDIMRKARIGSKDTYYRCLKELHTGGYLIYQKSHSRFSHATITMHALFDPISGTVPVLETGHTNPDSGNNDVLQEGRFFKQKNKYLFKEGSNVSLPPSQEEVVLFFQQQLQSGIEALKFWHQYEATAWHAGGSRIRNWQQLAHKWILNLQNVNAKNTQTNNDYNEQF